MKTMTMGKRTQHTKLIAHSNRVGYRIECVHKSMIIWLSKCWKKYICIIYITTNPIIPAALLNNWLYMIYSTVLLLSLSPSLSSKCKEYKIFYNIFQLNKFAFAKFSVWLQHFCFTNFQQNRNKEQRMRQKKVNKTFVCIILCADCISYPKFTTIKYLKTMKVSGPKPKMWAIKIKCHFHICGNRIAKCKENESFLMKIENNKHENSRADHQRNSKFWIFCLCFFVVLSMRRKAFNFLLTLLFCIWVLNIFKNKTKLRWDMLQNKPRLRRNKFRRNRKHIRRGFLHYGWTNYWMLDKQFLSIKT